jgi:hypothetical protein
MNFHVNKYLLYIIGVYFLVLSCVVKQKISENQNCYYLFEKAEIEIKECENERKLNAYLFLFEKYLKIIIENEIGVSYLNFTIYEDSIKYNGLLKKIILKNNLENSEYISLLKKSLIEKIIFSKLNIINDKYIFLKNGLNIKSEKDEKLLISDLNQKNLGSVEYLKVINKKNIYLPIKYKILVNECEIIIDVKKIKININKK